LGVDKRGELSGDGGELVSLFGGAAGGTSRIKQRIKKLTSRSKRKRGGGGGSNLAITKKGKDGG